MFRVTRGTNQITTWVANPTLGANPDTMCPDHEGGFWIGTTTPKFSLEHVLPNGSLKQLISGPPFTNYEGLAFVPQLAGDLVFGDVNTSSIRAVNMNAARTGFSAAPRVLISTATGGVHSLEVGPKHRIYFSGPNGIYRLAKS